MPRKSMSGYELSLETVSYIETIIVQKNPDSRSQQATMCFGITLDGMSQNLRLRHPSGSTRYDVSLDDKLLLPSFEAAKKIVEFLGYLLCVVFIQEKEGEDILVYRRR